MNASAIAAAISARVTDSAVYEAAERGDCSLAVARGDLEAEAFSDLTGLPLDYRTDWRERKICLCPAPQGHEPGCRFFRA